MAPGAPRSKRKPVRGKGKSFSRNLRPLDDEEIPAVPTLGSGSEDEANSGSEESESDDAAGPSTSAEPMTRAERRAAEKARKEAAKLKHAGPIVSDDDGSDAESTVPSAPSVKKLEKGVGGIRISNPNDPRNASSEPSRREREAMAAAAAKERYWKLQQEGKTDQAKADLARLAEIRREREEKAAMRKAELEEKKKLAEEKANQRVGKGRK